MTEHITTPASHERRPTVAVLGAGIAGLTAAHELAERGFVVTVYESRPDERNGLGSSPPGTYPPVKLGGLAASQYSTVGTRDGSQAELRPFPGRRGQPCAPRNVVAGEHGFRFFPAFYLHIWDLFQRIPVYQPIPTAGGTTCWTPTSRTVYDNVRRIVTKGITVEGRPSLVFPSELPRSYGEFLGTLKQLGILGFSASDIATYLGRLVSYLTTSPLRRERELQNLSAYDFLVGYDSRTGVNRFAYTPQCDTMLRQMPRILVALDSFWGDARTNMSTYLQLYLNMDRRDNKADGVLNGPTTESWLDHWYRYLVVLGVRFVHGAATCLDSPAHDPTLPPHLRPRAQITLADGTRLTPDYTVVAVDAPGAEYITAQLRAAGTGGAVAELDGFTTTPPPPDGPLQPNTTRTQARRDPYSMDEMGRVPWDRFQTLCGIQYYFDTEFQLLRGHLLLTDTEWALSSINQSGLWETQRVLDPDGHISVLSVDIGDFNTPSRHLIDEFGRGKMARDCTADEIAAEVWRQIVSALTGSAGSTDDQIMPCPVWYALDRSLVMAGGPGQGQGRVVRNESPYLVPIVGDWNNRPGSEPWNPHGSSLINVPADDAWREDLELRNVWQARHGGYQVHNNSVVFAGTWTKTFTRVTSMESACESGRHAVNAILDHYIWVESGGVDRREQLRPLAWEFPFGFVDQGLSSPIRMPSPAGDYCYVFDIENREPAETRPLRMLDTQLTLQSLPHALDTSAVPLIPGGQQMFTPTADYQQQMLAYLQTWRHLLDQWTAMATALPSTFAQYGMPVVPPLTAPPPLVGPPSPLGPPPAAPASSAPPDYTQQLFASLQAWRQYLEQVTAGQPGVPPSPPPPTAGPAAQGGTANQSGQARPVYTTNAAPPAVHDGSKGVLSAAAYGASDTWPPRPAEMRYRETDSMVPGENVPAHPGVALKEQHGYRPPPREDFHMAQDPAQILEMERLLDAKGSAATAFRQVVERLDPDMTPRVEAKSLYTIAQAAAPKIRDAGQTTSP
ncbi:FAD-dependent oxidoreductase [Mycolicibacterium gadium]|uniref:FAD-dependent oxidoreductase n=1 Tax=Mycolicibacterium gadium TaxID=1794 RepID=UPI0013D744BE|nr:FAD-dependent oxidoreductase [Mycolicibacterium gadium]